MTITLRNTKGSPLTHAELDENFSSFSDASDTAKGDALIGVKLDATGAVARTQHGKNAERVSVTDFYANGASGAAVAGDGVTDCTAGIQAAIDAVNVTGGGTLYFPKGTYLISDTLSMKKGVLLKGEGVMNPDNTASGSIIKLAANADCKMLETPAGASGNASDAVHYMGIEDIVFNGNVDNQTRSTEFTAVDFRGAFVPSYIRRVFIKDVWGPGLKTGYGGDVVLEDVWIYRSVTDNYAYSHNEGYVTNAGLMKLDGVFVEYTHKATGYSAGETVLTLRSTPTRRGKAIYIGNPTKFVASGRSIHVEAAQPCITLSAGEHIDLGFVRGNYFGDDTNGDVVKIADDPQTLNIGMVRGQNPSSGTLKLVEASGAGSNVFPDVDYSASAPSFQGYRVNGPSSSTHGVDYLGITRQRGRRSDFRTSVSASGDYAVLGSDLLLDITSSNVTGVLLPAVTGLSATTFDGRDLEIFNRASTPIPVTANGSERIYPGGVASIVLGHTEAVKLRSIPNIGWWHTGTLHRETQFVTLMDDFLGDVLADQWNGRVGSDPQCVTPTIVVGGQRGYVRLTTGDDAAGSMAVNGVQLDCGQHWRANQGNLVFECRVAISAITDIAVYVGLTDQVSTLEMPFTLGGSDALTSNATNGAGFLFDTGADTDNWWAVGVATDVDATHQNLAVAPVAATFETLRIEISSAGVAKFLRNGAVIGLAMTGALTTNVSLTPVVAAFSRGAASRNIDVDFIFVQANR